MSFARRKRLMEEGDTVLLYLGYDNLVPLQLASGRVHQTRYGALKHERLIGAQYGVKVDCSKGWVFPLQPTAELWTLALPHRTQILYTPDISLIVMELYLKPGAVVIEAGTGSGSLSHALIRSIMPSGHLHTFEFHEERCEAARMEFEQHGLGEYVTARHRDVCSQGFELTDVADAVFLDLPAPWECITSAKQALKKGGRICTFSPCMEQVQKTCDGLRQHGFDDVTSVECLARNFNVQTVRLAPIDFGDAIASSEAQSEGRVSQKMAKRDTSEGKDDKSSLPSDAPVLADSTMDADPQQSEGSTSEVGKDEKSCAKSVTDEVSGVQNGANSAQRQIKGNEFKNAAPPATMQGHTGFLTFASLY